MPGSPFPGSQTALLPNANDPELELLGLGIDSTDDHAACTERDFRGVPLFTGDARDALRDAPIDQHALYGRLLEQHTANGEASRPGDSPKLYINTDEPFSALVCGVQGSGKSHSTSVLLESCLISDRRIGTLPEPLSALLFHYDTAAGSGCVQPCEAAHLAALDQVRGGGASPPPVTVLVLPTNLIPMKAVYAGLPHVRVEPLHFAPQDISGERLLAMMKVDDPTQMPLYMECIMSILRGMTGAFDYRRFRRELASQNFSPGQKAMLNLRLALLDSCLEAGTATNRVANHFKKGALTIIDLSSPFMDGASACGLFDMILGLFIEAETGASGKLIVLDEAHKYLSESTTSSRLTESILTIIRQQRHLGTRVVISTQEPTVVPSKFLDLCSFIIAHRFSSPAWLRVLGEHVSAAGEAREGLFQKIVALRTGQAIIFAPTGLIRHPDTEKAAPLAQGYLLARSRLRITRDGGQTLRAVRNPAASTRLERVVLSGPGWDAPPTPPAESEVPKAKAAVSASTPHPVAAKAATPTVAPKTPAPQTSAASQLKPAAAQTKVVSAPPSTKAFVTKPPLPTPLPSSSKPSTSVSAPAAQPKPPASTAASAPSAKYAPLLAVLTRKDGGLAPSTLKTVRKHFRTKQPGVYGKDSGQLNKCFHEAAQLGLVKICGQGSNKYMQPVK